MALPCLKPTQLDTATAGTDSVLLAVYAPFGTDSALSTYPAGASQDLAQHPLVRNLLRVAKLGAHVAALVDRVGQDTMLVEIPAGQPARIRYTSCWKQDMASPHTLAGFLRRAHASHETSALVLCLEGHGAGFLPEIDRTQMTARNITQQGAVPWRITGNESPTLPVVSPMLPVVSPMLPVVSPMLPANHMPLSNWGLADALRRARESGVPKLAVLHLNNCFNMSVELLHTVARHAEYATGYINYNFFTAGDSYPWVFQQLAAAGTHHSIDLATWFADGNEHFLEVKGNHPTVGSVVRLARMGEIAERIDDLADELLTVLRANPLGSPARNAVLDEIQKGIKAARQLDSPNGAGFELETPDEMTDIRSLAIELQKVQLAPRAKSAARRLEQALKGILRYGAHDAPWVDTAVDWDFSADDMAMNILLPDPLRRGLWDWRSPFYMNVNPNPNAPQVQPHVIDFLKITDWVDFIDEYHKDVPFIGLLAAKIPEFPVFNATFVPPEKPGKGCCPPVGDQRG